MTTRAQTWLLSIAPQLERFRREDAAEVSREPVKSDRQRVIDEFLSDCGPEDLADPIGWLIATHHELVRQLNEAKEAKS